jgi:hypothetical protein
MEKDLYKYKYLKYKNKYINLELQIGGELLGKGAWGEVNDLCIDKTDLCETLKESATIKAYKDYNKEKNKFETIEIEYDKLKEWIADKDKNKITKKFTKKDKFETE